MKNVGTVVAAVFLGIILLLYMCTFQVRFTGIAIKKTWGKPAPAAVTEPGLKFKWPYPIQSVVVYDKRIRILEDRTEETRTVDAKNLLLTTFTLWRINDAAKFHTNFPAGVEDGERKLRTTVVNSKQAVTGKHEFVEFVSTDPADRKIRDIEREMERAIARDAIEEYGIEVVGFGIKKLALPESVTVAIFESMKTNEQKKAARYTAEGEAQAAEMLAKARAAEDRIMAVARQKVAEIEARAERVVSEYYKEFDRNPELRIFLDWLRTVEEALRERTTLIIDTHEAPWSVFSEEVRKQVPRDGIDLNGAAVAGERGVKEEVPVTKMD
jgi:membrane protease subunit HflC